jgi:hypothetical protein
LELLVAQDNRPAAAGVTSALTGVVLFYPALEIVGDPGVEGPVAALDDVDEPILNRTTVGLSAVLDSITVFSHRD